MREWRRRHKNEGGEILIKVDDNDADTQIIYCDCMFFDGEDDSIDFIADARREV